MTWRTTFVTELFIIIIIIINIIIIIISDTYKAQIRKKKSTNALLFTLCAISVGTAWPLPSVQSDSTSNWDWE